MKLQPIKCKHLGRAYSVAVSPSYIVACTGRKAHILDRELQLLQTIDGLNYVYSAQISPDEKKILLISNANHFYIADINTSKVRKVALKAPYHSNLEGRGCWSFDGESVFLLAANSKTHNSALRRYSVDDLTVYEDILAETFCLTQIHRLEARGLYLLIGFRRGDGNRTSFVYFDGMNVQEYPLDLYADRIVFGSDVDSETGNVILYSDMCREYSCDGKYIKTIEHPRPTHKERPVDDFVKTIFDEGTKQLETARAAVAFSGKGSVDVQDTIDQYGQSGCGRYQFFASKTGFYVVDAERGEVIAEIPEQYGVQNFRQISADTIALSTWSGVKLYQMID